MKSIVTNISVNELLIPILVIVTFIEQGTLLTFAHQFNLSTAVCGFMVFVKGNAGFVDNRHGRRRVRSQSNGHGCFVQGRRRLAH